MGGRDGDDVDSINDGNAVEKEEKPPEEKEGLR